MIASEVVVIDYGIGNLLSVRRGLEHCGANVKVTSDPQIILSASRVVLPGVGAFADGMSGLCDKGLDSVVREIACRNVPLLGICLGMQMLLDESEEFGVTAGLGLIPGRVIPVPANTVDGQLQKIPHIGWNDLVKVPDGNTWGNTLLQDIDIGEAVYFVHSFMAVPMTPELTLAHCVYGGIPVSAVIQNKNVLGCQFHPEKSGEVGLRLLSRFLKL
ncbi:MAG: imidazole glycerol phosphate synthase subunit HisH [Nitrospina sp.]|nr:imidazole glycerol phosphate synthase subunit HisH [Nitrospina sp.]